MKLPEPMVKDAENGDKFVVVGLRLSRDVFDEMQAESKRRDVSLADVFMSRILEEHLARQKQAMSIARLQVLEREAQLVEARRQKKKEDGEYERQLNEARKAIISAWKGNAFAFEDFLKQHDGFLELFQKRHPGVPRRMKTLAAIADRTSSESVTL